MTTATRRAQVTSGGVHSPARSGILSSEAKPKPSRRPDDQHLARDDDGPSSTCAPPRESEQPQSTSAALLQRSPHDLHAIYEILIMHVETVFRVSEPLRSPLLCGSVG
eukprot:1850117-Prymnesium_polylepis.1